MSVPNPLPDISGPGLDAISSRKFVIAGMLTTVYGLEELRPDVFRICCLWLLHPRLQTQACMEPLAKVIVDRHTQRAREGPGVDASMVLGLIAVSFDQRNHGTRELSAPANDTWRSGNPRHAQDLFSTYHGTAIDTSLLLDHLPAYIFPLSDREIVDNIVLGVSLGGHAAWQCLLHEPRITAGIVVIGCPDYVRLMCDRAAKSKLQSWVESEPPGASFLGSSDFPSSLIASVKKWDPAGLLMSGGRQDREIETPGQSSLREMEWLRPLFKRCLGGKKILNLAGAADKLVPYACCRPFLEYLQVAASEGSDWFSNEGLEVQDKVYEDVGHDMSREMVDEAWRFLTNYLERKAAEFVGKSRRSNL